MQIRRGSKESLEAFCFKLCNRFGGGDDLKVQASVLSKDGKDIIWFKPLKVIELMYYRQGQYISKVKMTKARYMSLVQHRSVLPCEVMVDIDDLKINHVTLFPNYKSKMLWAVTKLKKENMQPVVHFTGNKSYHISCFNPELATYTELGRYKYKLRWIQKLGGDLQLANKTAQISCEGMTHYRSGKVKEECTWVYRKLSKLYGDD